MSDLLVKPEYEGISWKGLAEATPVLSGAIQLTEDCTSGNAAVLLIDAPLTALDTVSMLADPIGTLVSAGAGFLLDYMAPLHQELEMLTGSPEQVKALAATWDNLAAELGTAADDHRRTAISLSQEWTGVAADSYQRTADGLATATDQVAQMCSGIADALEMSAAVVQVVYEIVKGIISDLVAEIVTLLLEEMATAGFGTPVVIAQAISKIAAKAPKVADWVEKIQKVLKEVNDLFGELGGLTSKLETVFMGVSTRFMNVGSAQNLARPLAEAANPVSIWASAVGGVHTATEEDS
jgi:uncharacterized protein YukE